MGLMVHGFSHLEYLVPQPQMEKEEEAAGGVGAVYLYNANGCIMLATSQGKKPEKWMLTSVGQYYYGNIKFK